jgi:ATP-dependent DNA helicase RecQ
MTPTPQTILKDTFGYDDFLPRQREVIENVLQKKDTLAIMPTGGGKSLCYQIPALLLPGLTIVVSPLIALMKDQIDQLKQLGIPAVTLNSSLAASEYFKNTEQIRKGHTKLIYMAPETLRTDRISNLLENIKVDLLVVDEAHCISEWGHDFRPEYREIIDVRKSLKDVTCLALTATATQRVRGDIKKSLGFQDHNEFISSFDRKNLIIEVVEKSDPVKQAVEMIEQYPGRPGIIYCFSRNQVDGLADELIRRKYSALPYHAGLDDAQRKKNQEAFIRDDVNIIVATVAFGMGINKPDVRYVLHYDLPKSLEGYYQEIGRAGRDGQPATCRLLFSYGDKNKLQYIIRSKSGKERLAAEEQLDAMIHYVEASGCRRKPLLSYFGETYQQKSCGMCDWCRASEDTMVDITIPAQKFMSCVKRSGEVFGVQHIVDILMGTETEKVRSHNHQALSTFGIGRDREKADWLTLTDQLMSLNFIEKTGEFNSLKLTESAMEALRTRQTITAVKPKPQRSLFEKYKDDLSSASRQNYGEPREYSSGSSRSFGEPRETIPARRKRMPEADNGLYEALRQLRKSIADREHIPPYAIFPDRTLVEMSAYRPQNFYTLKQIHGVGSVKSERFGDAFLKEIARYCKEHKLEETPKRGAVSLETQQEINEKKPRFVEVAREFIKGSSIDDLAKKHNVQPQTIFGHLVKYAKCGESFPNPERFLTFSHVPATVREKVLNSFDRNGSETLTQVYNELNGSVDFNELRVLQLYYVCTRKTKPGGK